MLNQKFNVIYSIWNRKFLSYKLSRFLNNAKIPEYVKEAKEDRIINQRMLMMTGYTWNDIDPLGIVIYAAIRSLRPKIVIETGVQSGISSIYILQALEKNNSGFLYSIDLPDREAKKVGEVVPDGLKDKWQLILGDAKTILPQLLEKLKKVDIFMHDSLHTYEHMLFEFEYAFKYLGDNGIIASHDILSNKAFEGFCNQHNMKKLKLYNIGLAKIK